MSVAARFLLRVDGGEMQVSANRARAQLHTTPLTTVVV